MVGNAIQNAIELRKQIQEFIDPVVAPTVGAFVAASTNQIPPALRPAQAAYRRLCDIHAATGLVGQALSSAALLGPACAQYLGVDNPVFVPAAPPFTGGQCVGVNYSVAMRTDLRNTSGEITQTTFPVQPFIPGPVRGIIQRKASGDFLPPGQGSTQWGRWLVHSTPIAYTLIGSNSTASSEELRTTTILSVTRTDGQPDNCGNVPVDGPGSYPRTRTTPPPAREFVYQDYGGPAVVVNIGEPTVNVSGEFSVPLTIGDVSFDFSGGLPGGNTPKGGLPIGESGEPVSTDDEQEIEAPGGKKIIGAFIEVTESVDRDTTIGLTRGRTYRVPRYGSVFFGDRGGFEGQFNIQLVRQLVWSANPTGNDLLWSSPLMGNIFTVTPILLDIE